jgi:hypothetical protein
MDFTTLVTDIRGQAIQFDEGLRRGSLFVHVSGRDVCSAKFYWMKPANYMYFKWVM